MEKEALNNTTELEFDGTSSIKKGFTHIVGAGGNTIGGASKKAICNLFGEILATACGSEKIDNGSGGKTKVLIYRSNPQEGMPEDEYKITEERVYKNGNFYGTLIRKRKTSVPMLLLGIALMMLAVVILLVALIDLPYTNDPVINVSDDNGKWAATGTVAVFDETIHPGSEGTYNFVVKNDHNVELNYSFTFTEYLNDQEVVNCPIEYRVRMNNGLLLTEEWLPVTKLNYTNLVIKANSSQYFTLEWHWLYENGDDERDTLWGIENGTYNLIFNLTAELVDDSNLV
jgi:hypothetical protein